MLVYASNGYKAFVKVKNSEDDKEYALYLIQNNETVFKLWYQELGLFILDDIDTLNGFENCTLKLYTKDKKGVVTTNYYQVRDIKTGTPSDFLDFFKSKYTADSIRLFIDCFVEHKLFFQSLMQIKHGSTGGTSLKKFLHDLSNELNEHISFSGFNFYKDEIKDTMLSVVSYMSEDEVILSNMLRVISTSENEITKNYVYGVVNYKLGNYKVCESYFQKLLPFKEDLAYHQAACIAYRVNVEPHIETPNDQNFNILNKCNITRGVILMSCDYGYYVAYAIKTIQKCIEYNLRCHVHLVLKYPSMLDEIDVNWFKQKNIGLSYEMEPKSGNHKTYYSISRYIILADVIDLYQTPVIVSDVDMNFDTDFGYLFEENESQKIGLIINHELNLPWLQILAGFNYFGEKTSNSNFVKYLRGFLIDSYNSGIDPWMLDQVALKVTLQKIINENIIFNLNESVRSRFRQYENRNDYRMVARTAVKSFDS